MNIQNDAQKEFLFDGFNPHKILSEYEDIEVRTEENQRRLADILKRDPSEKNFSDVYSIVQRLLEAERKDENVSTGGRPDNPYIRYVAGQLRVGGVGLEIGCAQGRLSEYLVERGHYIVGIDSSRDAIEVAKGRCKDKEWSKNCTFLARDARDLKDFREEIFDFAISTEVVEHLGAPGFVLHMDQLKRVLKRGGKYFVTCPSALIYGTEGDLHIRMYYYQELYDLARILGFRVRYIFNYRKKFIFTVPEFFNFPIIWYERILRFTRANYIFNYLNIYFLCLPMNVVFVKIDDDKIKSRKVKKSLISKGFYRS